MAESTPRGEIRKVLEGLRRTLWGVACFSVVINLLLLTPSIYMLQVYDRVLPSHNETTLWMLTALILGLYALSSLLDHLRSLVAVRLAHQVDDTLGQRAFDASLQRNLQQPHAHVTQPLADLAQLRQFLGSPSVFAFFDAPWFPFYLVVIFLFDTWLGTFALVGTLILVLLAAVNEWVASAGQRDAGRSSVKAMQSAADAFRNAEVVQAMGMQEALYRRWRKVHQEAAGLLLRAAERGQAVAAVTRFFKLALQSMVLGVGALLVLQGELTGGMMIAASILMGRTLAPVEQLITVRRQWSQVRDAYRRLSTLLDQHPATPQRLQLPAPVGRVEVDALSLAPPGRTQLVVRETSFTLEPGDVLAVVGASGSGKSSLARALVGVWAPTAGTVRLDGAELSHWPAQQRGDAVGYMPQDVELFEGTVAENIARFHDAPSEAIVAAAQEAGVHELILRLPEGYDTRLGDRGAGLSGGQKQRIALARAMFGSPRLVVLDEPNSSLDEVGEQGLVRCIRRLRERRCTTVLVTHRPSALAEANKLLVMQDGKLQMFGPKDQLLARLAQARRPAPAAATPARVTAESGDA
ncbi:MAG TPA: type I secretion system permease/ATPase [Ramlibacter sp.]|nr:type I secretion system permease/ATPase [Ramlibacter sp.]